MTFRQQDSERAADLPMPPAGHDARGTPERVAAAIVRGILQRRYKPGIYGLCRKRSVGSILYGGQAIRLGPQNTKLLSPLSFDPGHVYQPSLILTVPLKSRHPRFRVLREVNDCR